MRCAIRNGAGLCLVFSGKTMHSVWYLSNLFTKHWFLFSASLSLSLQPHLRSPILRQFTWLPGPKVSIWTRCPFLPITPPLRHVWPTGSCQNISPHLHWRPAIAWLEDTLQWLCTSRNGTVQMWNFANECEVIALDWHQWRIMSNY